MTLVERKIWRVVIATLDPDPRNAGRGVDLLRAGGVIVAVGLLEQEALTDLGAYLALPANRALQQTACGVR